MKLLHRCVEMREKMQQCKREKIAEGLNLWANFITLHPIKSIPFSRDFIFVQLFMDLKDWKDPGML
jgi:hypothetical protein